MMLLRMEMRGSGLDTESRSPTPQDREDTKDEVYWWLHFHKLQEYHSYFRGKSNTPPPQDFDKTSLSK